MLVMPTARHASRTRRTCEHVILPAAMCSSTGTPSAARTRAPSSSAGCLSSRRWPTCQVMDTKAGGRRASCCRLVSSWARRCGVVPGSSSTDQKKVPDLALSAMRSAMLSSPAAPHAPPGASDALGVVAAASWPSPASSRGAHFSRILPGVRPARRLAQLPAAPLWRRGGGPGPGRGPAPALQVLRGISPPEAGGKQNTARRSAEATCLCAAAVPLASAGVRGAASGPGLGSQHLLPYQAAGTGPAWRKRTRCR